MARSSPQADPALMEIVRKIRFIHSRINGLAKDDFTRSDSTSEEVKAWTLALREREATLGRYVYEYLKFSRNLENDLATMFQLPEAEECISNS